LGLSNLIRLPQRAGPPLRPARRACGTQPLLNAHQLGKLCPLPGHIHNTLNDSRNFAS
jgi:hypothetical protein